MAAIAIVFCIQEDIDISQNFRTYVSSGYELGVSGSGGGAVGAIFAYPFIKLLGTIGAMVLSIGIAIISAIYIFEIKIANILFQLFVGIKDKREERKEALQEEKKLRREEMEQIREKQKNNYKQVKLDLDNGKENKKLGFLKSLNFDEGEKEDDDEEEEEIKVQPSKASQKSNKSESEKAEQDEELFKEQEAEKENTAKQVLQLEHAMVIEEDNYEIPSFNLLNAGKNSGNSKNNKKEIVETVEKLQRTLNNFGVSAKVVNVSRGPSVTRYEIQPDEGVSVKKIANLADDIALNLAATALRIEAPIPRKTGCGNRSTE